MKKEVNPAVIGGFVVSGILLTVAAVILFGSGRLFEQSRTYVSFFPGSVNGLTVGSNVAFRGVPIGTVREIRLAMNFDEDDLGESMRIPVVFQVDFKALANRGVSTALDADDRIDFMLERGMSARLDTESFLTGRLYVSLDFRPDIEQFTQGGPSQYPEIPTVRSPMAEVGNKVQQLADRFVGMDFEEIFDAFRRTLDGATELLTSEQIQSIPGEVGIMVQNLDVTLAAVRELAESVDATVAPLQDQVTSAAAHAEASMIEVDETLDDLQGLIDPQAPLLVGLVRTLEELELAASSLRRVADMIERDPAVLVRGRDTGGND
jgi:phospholipid/cholesterol/gamma-HCH transport system substrate-binding protein